MLGRVGVLLAELSKAQLRGGDQPGLAEVYFFTAKGLGPDQRESGLVSPFNLVCIIGTARAGFSYLRSLEIPGNFVPIPPARDRVSGPGPEVVRDGCVANASYFIERR